MRATPLLISALLPFLSIISSVEASQPAQNWFAQQGYVAPTNGQIVACHGYGCARRTVISVAGSWLSRAASLLQRSRGSPEAERRALGEVVRTYTAYLAASFGGKTDVPGSPAGMSGVQGQMDCLDETANTTSLLLVLQERGLLVHHRVEHPESRGFFFDGRYPHFTAVMAERQSGAEWAVDPWRRAPGQSPEILPLARWRQDS